MSHFKIDNQLVLDFSFWLFQNEALVDPNLVLSIFDIWKGDLNQEWSLTIYQFLIRFLSLGALCFALYGRRGRRLGSYPSQICWKLIIN